MQYCFYITNWESNITVAYRQENVEKNYTLCNSESDFPGNSVFGEFPSVPVRQLGRDSGFFENPSDLDRIVLRAQEELEARTRCKMKLKVRIF